MIDLSDIENRESEIGMKDPNVRNHHFIGVGVNPQETFDRKMEPLGTSSPEKQDGSPDYLTVDEQDCSSDSIATSEVNRRQESKSVDGDTPGAPDPEGARGARGGEMGQSGQRPVRQPLLRAIHLELSQLAAEADGVSEKVKRIINKQRQRLDSLIEETTKAPRILQTKIAAPLDKRRRQVRGNIRKAVTGDPHKSVRLHLEEKRSKPFMMRMMDKAAFTVGVLTMIVSEYVLLLMPERFWLWYSVMIPVLLLMRYPDYRQRKWLFFYLDFCYYVQVCCMIAIFVLPHDCRLNKVIFMYTMGSLLWAVPIWRNSLVFHDVDKMTSCFIHLFPSWLALTLRWCPLDPWRGGTPSAEPECSEGINLGDMGLALFLYLLWQLLYYIKTEYQDRSKLDADPEIQTSLRWLTTSPKNKMHQVVLWLMRRLKFFKKEETFNPHTFKTKMIFMASQLVYTLIVSLPTPFLYNNKPLSISLAFVVFIFALWNSSNYYIDVFSRRYWATMEAEAAAKSEALLIKAAKVRERELAHELASSVGDSISEGSRDNDALAIPHRTFSGLSTSSSGGENQAHGDREDEQEEDAPVGEEEVDNRGEGHREPIAEKSKDV